MPEKVSITKTKLDNLANAISAKSGEPLNLTIDEMEAAVNGINIGEENVLEGVKVNGVELPIDSQKKVNIPAASQNKAGVMTPSIMDDIYNEIDSIYYALLDTKADKSEIPTKTSQLINDSSFAVDSNYVHTDNNFTTALKDKLDGVASGAEVNVQSDWNVTDTSSDAFIKNKPSIPVNTSDLVNNSNFVSDANYVHTDNNLTNALVTKLNGIAEGAEVNVQSDWNISDSSSDAFIKNKPSIPTKVSDLTNDSGFITTSIYFGTCASAAADAAKVVTCADFTDLEEGSAILVNFSATNTAETASLTLNVNSTGAKRIQYINNGTRGNLNSAGYLKASTTYLFIYDGNYWVAYFNYNTTYSSMTEAEIAAGTGTTARTITPARLKIAVGTWAPVTSVNNQTGDVSLSIPDSTSDLTNDSGFITSASLPTKVSDLTNDSGFITNSEEDDPVFTASAAYGIQSSDITNWNNKSDFSGNYNDLTNKPTIPTVPTNVSAFTNDAGYLTSYTETDPVFSASPAAGITSSNITNWNNYYKVRQENVSNNAIYPVLLGYQVGDVAVTEKTLKSSNNFNFNPSTGNLNATTFNSYTLNESCARLVDTSISTSSSSTNLPTSAAVANFVENKGYLTLADLPIYDGTVV